jgi:hypothetical protein
VSQQLNIQSNKEQTDKDKKKKRMETVQNIKIQKKPVIARGSPFFMFFPHIICALSNFAAEAGRLSQ